MSIEKMKHQYAKLAQILKYAPNDTFLLAENRFRLVVRRMELAEAMLESVRGTGRTVVIKEGRFTEYLYTKDSK